MSTLTDVENAINILVDNGLKKDVITVLHCNTEYPTPLEDVNLYAMNTMKKIKYKCWIFRSYIRNRCSNSCCKPWCFNN